MIANDFIHYLENNGYGVVADNLFDNFQQASPDNCITAFDVSAPNISESSSLSVDLLGLQVIVRNSSSANAKGIIKNIHTNFIGFGGESLVSGGDVVSASFVDLPPYCLGKDEKGRTEWTVTYNLRVQTTTNKYRL